MINVEQRLRLSYKRHKVVSLGSGYFVCFCGCNYIGVCRHCVPNASSTLSWMLCDEARTLVQSGQAQCMNGHVYASA